MSTLLRKALIKADEVRAGLDLNIYEPVNILEACLKLNITVRIVDVNMEGMYFSQDDHEYPEIFLSNQRPLPRRNFTCAHELGHHIFGHGSKIDGLSTDTDFNPPDDAEEFLVDCFAGAMLMPLAGIHVEFKKRNWDITTATPIQVYTIASAFGIGYQTLVTHCRANNMISEAKAKTLGKITPAQILKTLIGPANRTSYFRIIDHQTNIMLIDVEETNYIIFPKAVTVEGDHLEILPTFSAMTAYRAVKAGVVRVIDEDENAAYFVRIQRTQYVGLAEYRHLEPEQD